MDVVLFREIETACGQRFGIATLNAPATLNALSLSMVNALYPTLQAWAADPQVVGVMLEGTGEKAFCAGGDIMELYHSIREPGDAAQDCAEQFFSREYRLDHLIHTFPKPVLCWANGIVMGGGMGLMLGASHRVVTPRSRLAMPEVSIGLFPDVGGSWFLSRLPGRLGLFLGMTGAPMNAADAMFVGCAELMLANESKQDVLAAIAAADWTRHEDASAQLARILESFALSEGQPESNVRRNLDAIGKLMGHDDLASIARRLTGLASGDAWLDAAAANFSRGSPTSATLAYEMWQRSRRLSLADIFRLELNVAVGCCAHPDFQEGVRALLVDKDKAPKWNPARMEDVSGPWIDAHLKARYRGAHPLADLAEPDRNTQAPTMA